jgi:hypothetical protein
MELVAQRRGRRPGRRPVSAACERLASRASDARNGRAAVAALLPEPASALTGKRSLEPERVAVSSGRSDEDRTKQILIGRALWLTHRRMMDTGAGQQPVPGSVRWFRRLRSRRCSTAGRPLVPSRNLGVTPASRIPRSSDGRAGVPYARKAVSCHGRLEDDRRSSGGVRSSVANPLASTRRE